MNYQTFITPIFVRMLGVNQNIRITFVGNGFFIDNYFITAAHVIKDNQGEKCQSNPYIIVDGCEIELTREKAYRWKTLPYDMEGQPFGHDDIKNGDVAVFKMLGMKSELKLSKTLPSYGDILSCDFFHIVSPDNHSLKKDTNSLYLWETQGTVYDASGFSGNFFGATMSPIHPTDGGSSGCPLIKNNIVYGILHAGNPKDSEDPENPEHPEICVFYSASDILKIIAVR